METQGAGLQPLTSFLTARYDHAAQAEPSSRPYRLANRPLHPDGAIVTARVRIADKVFDMRSAARVTRRRHVICLGDSHVAIFSHVRVSRAWFRPFQVPGATASGILNPNSWTSARTLFNERLAVAKRWQHVVLCLGEVDCGFLIWHRAQRSGLSVEDQLDATLTNYLAFLRSLRDRGFASLSVLSVPLPTIADDPWKRGEIANLRKEVTATQQERTDLTLRFNEELRRRVAGEDICFIDATSSQLDRETGMIDRRLVRGQLDHHLRDAPYAALIAGAFSHGSTGRVRPRFAAPR